MKEKKDIFGNIKYAFNLQIKHCKGLLIIQMILIPIILVQLYADVLLPQKLIYFVINDINSQTIISTLAVFFWVICVLKITEKILINKKNCLSDLFNGKLKIIKQKKRIRMSYENSERYKYRLLSQKADEALWGSEKGCKIEQVVSETLNLIQNVLGYVIFGVSIAQMNVAITIILTITTAINYFTINGIMKYKRETRDEIAGIEKKQWYLINVSGDIKSAKDIRLYGINRWLIERYKKLTNQKMKWSFEYIKKIVRVDFVEALMILLRDGVAYFIIIYMLINNRITIDQFVFQFTLIGSFASWINSIIENVNNLRELNIYIADFRKYIETKDENEILDSALNRFNGGICLEDVSYIYDGDKNGIKDITLEIHSGEKVALVGANGAGKTTLAKILCGLYTPQKGKIYLDKINLMHVSREEVYSKFTAVFQDIHLFPVSIAQFISGKNKFDNNEIKRIKTSLKQVGLEEKILRLGKGIDTILNVQLDEEGVEFSGGEKQKLLLARAIFKEDAKVLILDEPTSALDAIAEQQLYRTYNELFGEKTSIFITQRLISTIFCDKIVYLEDGKIIEIGSHKELMEKKGRYAEMFEIQRKMYVEKEG